MATTNYKINDAALFWRRMVPENPSAITLSTAHPSTAEYFVGIEKTVDEIKQIQLNEIPLKLMLQKVKLSSTHFLQNIATGLLHAATCLCPTRELYAHTKDFTASLNLK
jgi:hypothetical protein